MLLSGSVKLLAIFVKNRDDESEDRNEDLCCC